MEGSRSEEARLIARARDRDEDAFAALVLAHSERVMAALRRFGLTPAEAEEVAQEVFLRAWRGLPRFEERARFSTWVYRIAFNESQRLLAGRPAALPPAVPGEVAIDRLTAAPDRRGRGPEARTLDREFETTLQAALAELPPDCRVAVILRDIEQLSTRDAAEMVGVRQAAFKSRLHRGRTQLRALLAPYLGRDDH